MYYEKPGSVLHKQSYHELIQKNSTLTWIRSTATVMSEIAKMAAGNWADMMFAVRL
jgi:hypothetical protein